MIQRIQSVYLFLAALFMGGLFLQRADLLRIETTNPTTLGEMNYYNDKLLDVYDQELLIVFSVIVIIFSLANIFMYRKRKLQLTLTRVSMLVVLLFLLIAIYMTYSDLAPYISSIRFSPALGLVVPFIVIVLLVLAARGIGKDEKLVRSMDRLR